MNSRQRRQAKRAFLRNYPYMIRYSAINKNNFLDSLRWCDKNINRRDWITCDELDSKPYTGYNSLSIAMIRFANQKDAVHFTLLWVGQ